MATVFQKKLEAIFSGSWAVNSYCRRADELWDLRVGVQAGEHVDAAGERPDECLVIEALRDFEIFLLAREPVEVGQRLVDPAVLGVEHFLHLRVAEPCIATNDPIAALLGDLQCLRIIAVDVSVQQTGEDFVQRVVRHPNGLALFDAIEELRGKRAQVAVAEAGLALRESAHQGSAPLAQPLVAGAGVHQGARGEIVPYKVPADLRIRLFPAAQRRRRGGQAGVEAEGVQQSVHVERQQVPFVKLHGVLERAVEQAHVAKLEGKNLQGSFVRRHEQRIALAKNVAAQCVGRNQHHRQKEKNCVCKASQAAHGARFLHGLSGL